MLSDQIPGSLHFQVCRIGITVGSSGSQEHMTIEMVFHLSIGNTSHNEFYSDKRSNLLDHHQEDNPYDSLLVHPFDRTLHS